MRKQVWDVHKRSISTSTCCSGNCCWLPSGHVWLLWQFLLPCFTLLTSGCLDRSGGPGREGRRRNTNVFLRDRRELELQRRSPTAADGFWRWTLKFDRKRAETPLSADTWHDYTLEDFIDTWHLLIRRSGGFSAFWNQLDPPAGRRWRSSRANIYILFIRVFFRWFDLKQKQK